MSSIRISARPARQRGQSLPLGLAAMMFTAILTLALFNTGQVTSEKMRLTNTADAAVYSGLVWQARGLNFQAYMNRAMVANQVSIAQVVSLVSWSRYLRTAARNLNYVLGWIPPVRPFTQAFYNASIELNELVRQVAEVAVNVLDGLLDVLRFAQQSVHVATGASTQEIVRKVVERNDARYRLTYLGAGFLAKNTADWYRFTKNYDDDDGLVRKADVITRSRDRFTRDRGWSERMLDVGIIKVELVKAGETRLMRKAKSNDADDDDWYGNRRQRSGSNLDWQWKGKDTLSVHLRWKCIRRWRLTTCREELPVGWGAALVSTTGQDIESCNEDDEDGGFWFFRSGCPPWSRNARAERLAEMEKDILDANYDGVRSYRDIADAGVQDPRLPLVVEVRVDHRAVRTSTKVKGIGSPAKAGESRNGMGTGMFRVADDFAESKVGDGGAQLAAIAKGEVFFRRPVKRVPGRWGATDSQDEFGSLYNPYWDVHLLPADRERIAAWATRGVADFVGLAGELSGGRI